MMKGWIWKKIITVKTNRDSKMDNQLTDEYYYVEGDDGMGAIGYFLECPHCKKKIMVEMGLFGTPHHHTPSAICADCVKLHESFREKHPELSEKLDKKLEEWKNG